MKLYNARITPGIVREKVDNYGTVKATVFGLFSDNDSTDVLPPIYPFFSINRGSFSTPQEGDKIWVISTTDNPTELLYFREQELKEDIKKVIDETGEEKVELLVNMEGKDGWAQLFFKDGDGWYLRNDKCEMAMHSDNIKLTNGSNHRTIHLNDTGISLGSEDKSAEPAVLGDKLVSLFTDMVIGLNQLATTAGANPYTSVLVKPITDLATKLQTNKETITSLNVTLD